MALTTNLIGMHFDRQDPDRLGMRIFVTDGLPSGTAEWFEGHADGARFAFPSAGGRARIAGEITRFETFGTITLADGSTRDFFTRPAGHGAGIFEISVSPDGGVERAIAGRFHPRGEADGRQGGGTGGGGQRRAYDLVHNDLSRRLAYSTAGGAADDFLAVVTRRGTEIVGRGGGEGLRRGRPSGNLYRFDTVYSRPGTYLAFIAPRGRFVYGRDGDVRGGRSGDGIIGFDKKC